MSIDDAATVRRVSDPVRAGIPVHGRVPRYYQVRAQLVELLETLGQEQALPPERVLAERFGVSRVTLRQAVQELVIEGKLRRRQGSGTYVSPPKFTQPLAMVSYTEAMRSRGVQPGRELVQAQTLTASGQLADELELGESEQVWHLERVLLANGERVGLESTYLPKRRFPNLFEVFDSGSSLYACLQQRLGVRFGSADERMETVLISPREAELLEVRPALPMLLMHRISRDDDGAVFERVRSMFRGDRFSFMTQLHA